MATLPPKKPLKKVIPPTVPPKISIPLPYAADYSMRPEAVGMADKPVADHTYTTADTSIGPGQYDRTQLRGVEQNNTFAAKPGWMTKVSGALGAAAPYISNMVNSFRRPPMPATPIPYNPVHFRRVNFGAAKTEADRMIAGQDQGLRYLPENEATAARTANMIQGLRAKGQYTMQEQNANAEIANAEATQNGRVDMANVNSMNQFNDSLVDRNIAIENNASANLANAGDKYVAIQNEKAKQQLEATKYGILQGVYSTSGVVNRLDARLLRDPVTGELRRMAHGGLMRAGGMMRVYGTGGELIGGPGDTGGDPSEANKPNPRYATGAQLAYYKEQLNQKLREKDPEGYDNFFKERTKILRSGDRKAADQFDQTSNFNAYLSPDEVKRTLGDEYDNYLNSVRQASQFIPGQQYKQLYGNTEGNLDPAQLNYGRRFATLSTLTSLDDHASKVRTDYSYSPKTGVKMTRSRI